MARSASGASFGFMDGGPQSIIRQSSIREVLFGVGAATKIPVMEQRDLQFWATVPKHLSLEAKGGDPGIAFSTWAARIPECIPMQDEAFRQVAYMTVAMAFVQLRCQQSRDVKGQQLDALWNIILGALTSQASKGSFTVSRSAQGLLAVPLCSLLNTPGGQIDQLYRLHVWLPDGQRGNPDFAVHSHQAFGQSWILAGEGADVSYEVQRVPDGDSNESQTIAPTHAEYSLQWNDGKKLGTKYQTHQAFSVVQRTSTLVRATAVRTVRHTRNMSYTIPPAAFHRSVVKPSGMHCTLFVFDARRGFIQNTGVLGPTDPKVESYVQHRDPAGITAADLAERVQEARLQDESFLRNDGFCSRSIEASTE